jgi:hypothetical protein
MAERVVRAVEENHIADELAQGFRFSRNPDGPEGEETGRWWIARCAAPGCTHDWDVRSTQEEELAIKLGDRNALLAHARSHAAGARTLKRRT